MSNNLSDYTKVALCVACTLLPGPMAQCATCPFNVGLYIRKAHYALLNIPEGAERNALVLKMPKAVGDIYYSYLRGVEIKYTGGYNPYQQLREACQSQ